MFREYLLETKAFVYLPILVCENNGLLTNRSAFVRDVERNRKEKDANRKKILRIERLARKTNKQASDHRNRKMIRVLVIGASSWIAQKLVESWMMQDGVIGDSHVTHLTLADVEEPDMPAELNHMSVKALQADISDSSHVSAMLEDLPQFIFHLAALTDAVEIDVELGYAVILQGTLTILETIRKQANYTPRLVFASSLMNYRSVESQDVSGNASATQKAIEELCEDFTRKGVLTATSIRLPVIVIRPGPPNATALSFLSSILREPLHGQETVLSVSTNSVFTIASWHAAVNCLLHAVLYKAVLPGDRVLAMPGFTLTIQQMIDALERVAGNQVVQRIRRASNPTEMEMLNGYPRQLEARRALELGFSSTDESFEAILLQYMKEEDLWC